MGVQVSEREGCVVIRFEDPDLIDDEQILAIRVDLMEVLESASAGTRLVLDFQEVERVASLLLSDLVTLNTEAARKGVIVQFCRLSPHVTRVIETCHLDRLFTVLDDPPDTLT